MLKAKSAELSFTKVFSLMTIGVVAVSALYGKLVYYGNSESADPSQFPLGKYPYADKVNKDQFLELFGNASSGRKYNSFFLFNALDPSAKCAICPRVDGDFKKLTSYIPVDLYLERKLSFATIDLSNGRELFGMLNVQTAPFLIFFKAQKAGDAAVEPEIFNIRNPMELKTMMDFVNTCLGTQIRITVKKTPVEYAVAVAAVVAILGLILATAMGKISKLVYNPWVAMVLSVGFVILMMSGYMFCKIRGIPLSLSAYDKSGMIVGGPQNQTGAEAWIFGSITLVNAASTVLLSSAVPKIENPIGRRVAAALFVTVITLGFHQLLQMITTKMPGYPLKLF